MNLWIMAGGVLNYTFTDVIALVLTPAIAFIVGWFKYWDTDKEKHKATISAEKEREERKIEAEVQRDKIKADAEVEKEREKSLGGEAVTKIWKEVTLLQNDISKLKELHSSDHSNDLLVNEIIQRLQQDVNRLMNAFFDKLLER